MTLTSQLRQAGSPISAFMRVELPHLDALAKAATAGLATVVPLPPKFERYPVMLVGTAIDLRIRLHLGARAMDRSIGTGLDRLAHVHGVSLNADGRPDVQYGHFENLFWRFEKELREMCAELPKVRGLRAPADEDALCRLCIILAYLEQLGRGSDGALGLLWPRRRLGLKRILRELDARIVGDLAALSAAFAGANRDLIASADSVECDGSPEGAPCIGGADFDMVVDGTLYETKTMINPGKLAVEALRQLAGYVLLDWNDALGIRAAGLMLPRQAVTLTWPVGELLRGRDLVEMRSKMKALAWHDGIRFL